ncbi:hypothetical protein DPMN_039716 [Dreissena polymorpha]|uniref:Uncharacterized protein n=1 Tax=Dreissena polymorpha TaxID=45954 RepID=A0A9D4CTR4_DREPO|nr:hypothetical protein DPMN_039716 [Dreissena polymorpha]
MRSKIEQKISEPHEMLVVVEGGTDAIDDAMSSILHQIPVFNTLEHQKLTGPMHLKKLREKIVTAFAKSWEEAEHTGVSAEMLSKPGPGKPEDGANRHSFI